MQINKKTVEEIGDLFSYEKMIDDNSIKDPNQEFNRHKGMNPLENSICNKLENDANCPHKNENENEEFDEEESMIAWEGKLTYSLE